MISNFQPIRRLRLKRFRSLLWADVELTNPLFVVGKNGAGKSNFLKALEFLASSMTLPLESVFQLHGGIETVRYRTGSRSRPGHFGIRVDFSLPGGDQGWYAFEIKAMPDYNFQVVREQCVAGLASFNREGQSLQVSVGGITPRVLEDALILPLLGGTQEFQPVVDLLGGIQVFSLEPRLIQELQKPDAGLSLKGDGSNLASVLKSMSDATLDRLCQLLGSVVPAVTRVVPVKHGKSLTLKFTQTWRTEGGGEDEISHEAFAMSDGTMRLVGILGAFLQSARPSVIALEEPESTIHPEALSTLLDLIQGFSSDSQVIVTTHSPDLLDCKWIEPENIRVATWNNGVTRIEKLDTASTQTLKQHLMGAGEMMRTEGLQSAELFEEINPEQAELFSKIP
ncbi:MAG: Recombination protein [Verrucomicrobiaceae bacterium]|nr:Recombination protein [Verrucomicrobiaceae bacterium]